MKLCLTFSVVCVARPKFFNMLHQSLSKYPIMVAGCFGMLLLILYSTNSTSVFVSGTRYRATPATVVTVQVTQPDVAVQLPRLSLNKSSTLNATDGRETEIATMSPASPIISVPESIVPSPQANAKFGVDIRSRAADHDFFLPQRLMNETGSFGIRRIKSLAVARRSRTQQCLAGLRVAFVGNSHLLGPLQQLAIALGYTTFHSTSFIKQSNFSVRFVYDTALFSDNMHDSTGSVILQEELRNASNSQIEAFRHDVVVINRGAWDLVHYNTNSKAVADGFYTVLGAVLDFWVNKRGGKIVVYPMHFSTSPSVCLSADRIHSVRLAVFAALHKFASERSNEVVVTSPQKLDKTKVNILLFDPYDFLSRQGRQIYDRDGHHLRESMTSLIADAWLQKVVGCGAEAKNPSLESMIATSFPASLTERVSLEEMDGMLKTVDDGPKKIDEPCGCLRLDFTSMHPACLRNDNLFSRSRRHLLVQYLLKYGIYGASSPQVHEFINIVCSQRKVELQGKFTRVLRKCYSSIGVGGEPFFWTAKDRRIRSGSKQKGIICNCHNAIYNVQNRTERRCAKVEALWTKNKETCIYMNPDADFRRG